MAVKLGNALASVQAESGFNTYVCIRKLADGLEATAGTLSTIISNNVVTNEFVTVVGNAAGADPTASVGLATVVGTAHTLMRSDAAPPLSQAISPTMTGTWAFAPTADATPVTINAPATADMEKWNPILNADTVVSDGGDVGVGDPIPTANVSIQARTSGAGGAWDYTTIMNLPGGAPFAWWDATDIWGDGTNNGAGNGHTAASDGILLTSPLGFFDKTGNGHDLIDAFGGSEPFFHKSCGPNGADAVVFHAGAEDTPNTRTWSNPWAGGGFGEPGTWTVVSVAFSLLGGDFAVVGHDRLDGDSYGSHVSFGVGTNYQARYVPAPEGPDTDGRYNKNKAVGAHTGMTGAVHGAANWHRFVWRYNGGTSHQAWIDGDLLGIGSPDESGGTVYSGRSGFTRINHNGQNQVSNCDHLLETILFQYALSDAELDTVNNYIVHKYSPSTFVPVVTQPLVHLKESDGTVDSIVDTSINVGLGTATPTSKLHVVGVVNIQGNAVASLSAASLATNNTFLFADPLPACVSLLGGGPIITGLGLDKAIAVFGPTNTDLSVAGGFGLHATPRMTFDENGGNPIYTVSATSLYLGHSGGTTLYFTSNTNGGNANQGHIQMANYGAGVSPILVYACLTPGGSHKFVGNVSVPATQPVVEVVGAIKATKLITGTTTYPVPPGALNLGVLSGKGVAGTDPGGDIYIVGGDGNEPGGGAAGGRGADIIVTPGGGGKDARGGNLTISRGAAGSGTGTAGIITVGLISDTGQHVYIITPANAVQAGASLAVSGGVEGGSISGIGGAAISGDTAGGDVLWEAGAGFQAGVGGAASLLAGAGGASADGGYAQVVAGAGGATGGGGVAILAAGAGGATSGNAGDASVLAGSTSGAGNAGSAYVTAGNSTTNGDGGSVHFQVGAKTGAHNNGKYLFHQPGSTDTAEFLFTGVATGTVYSWPNITGTVAMTSNVAAVISDAAYGAGWDAVTTIAPSKNAVYDKIQTLQPLDATLTSIAALGTAADKIAYTTAADTWAEAAITSAGRAIIDDADAATQRTTLGAAYAINVFAPTAVFNPTDAQTLYFGCTGRQSTTAGQAKVYFRRAGIIRIAEIFTYATATAGSNEDWSFYVRLNDTTDTLIATVAAATAERIFSNTAINVTVASGDFIEIKYVNPTWATNPSAVNIGGYLLVE